MELTEIQALISNPDELIKKVQTTKVQSKSTDKILAYQKQYDPKQHDVHNESLRRDKIVTTDDSTEVIRVARISISMQKKIVMLAAAFLCGNPIQLIASPADASEEEFLKVFKKIWADNKLDYDSKNLAKLMMSETEVAEIWYTEPIAPGYWKGTAFDTTAVKAKLRMKIVANKFGDQLYPVFSNAGDMIAFGRHYSLKIGDKTEEHFDLYTDDKIITMLKGEGNWIATTAPNPIGKIPVIYYSQDVPEWDDVQEAIDRLEKSTSNHGDTNDYHGDPMTIVKGTIKSFAKKGEAGKVLEIDPNADVSLLTWTQAPESVKMEQQNLKSIIFNMSSTPDISLENMKSLGVFSGIALKMLFLDAHLKAADKEETFGKSIQRRINFMKAALANINVSFEKQSAMSIKPKFEYFLPKNDEELINMLSTATGAKATMSQKTAVAANPLVQDAEQELKAVKEEGADAAIGDNL